MNVAMIARCDSCGTDATWHGVAVGNGRTHWASIDCPSCGFERFPLQTSATVTTGRETA